jgi:hypothetical protein
MGSRSLVQIAMYREATAWLGVPSSAVKAIRIDRALWFAAAADVLS